MSKLPTTNLPTLRDWLKAQALATLAATSLKIADVATVKLTAREQNLTRRGIPGTR